VIRLCLRFGVGPVFIPAGEPQFNGSVENFNGWFQEPLFQRRFQRLGDLRRELARLQEAVNTQHVHPRLGARRRHSTAGACDCRSCQRTSWCRRGGCRWPRGA
jgi:transposase InsO family protein